MNNLLRHFPQYKQINVYLVQKYEKTKQYEQTHGHEPCVPLPSVTDVVVVHFARGCVEKYVP